MKNTTKNIFFLAFILAIIAAIATFIYLKSLEPKEAPTSPLTTIIVASQNIPPRTVIQKNMINEIEVPIDAVYGNFISDKSEIMGKYSKETILKDERFHKDKLINELEELSLQIKGNNRAIAINVYGESGVSHMIKPGDFVDIIVYLPEIKESQRIARPDISKMILQNIEVLAIDKNLYRNNEANIEITEIPTNFLVTLSVPVNDVEKLVLAEDIGDLKLTLRPLDGDYIHETEGAIWQELILDDFYQMKDIFPQYEIKPVPSTTISDGEYTYEKYYYYTIQNGDTLRKISEEFYGDPDKYVLIQEVNRFEDENEINAGTGIKVPILILEN